MSEHIIEIYDNGQLMRQFYDSDISELTLKACSVLLGMSTTYIQVFIDGNYFNLPSQDIGKIRRDMIDVIMKNEEMINFGIDDLFSI